MKTREVIEPEGPEMTITFRCECVALPATTVFAISPAEYLRCPNDAAYLWFWVGLPGGIAVCTEHVALRREHYKNLRRLFAIRALIV